MDWLTIAQLIIQVGLPQAEKIWSMVQAGGNASQAQWDELQAMTKQTAVDRMKAVLTQAGIPLDSPQAVALLALAK